MGDLPDDIQEELMRVIYYVTMDRSDKETFMKLNADIIAESHKPMHDLFTTLDLKTSDDYVDRWLSDEYSRNKK